MKIGFVTNDFSGSIFDPVTGAPAFGGSGWYRIGMPSQYLARECDDLEVVVGGLVTAPVRGIVGCAQNHWSDSARIDHWDCDLIVLQRFMFADLADEIQRARANGQIVVNDVDDWFLGLSPSNHAFNATHPRRVRDVPATFAGKVAAATFDSDRNHYMRILAASSALTVSTPYLRERYGEHMHGMPIHVLPNAIDPDRWGADQPDRSTRPGRTCYGWVGAIPWRSTGDLPALSWLGEFAERHDLSLLHAGYLPAKDWKTFADYVHADPERMRTLPMESIDKYPRLFAPLDVGFVPLEDAPFNRAKSYVKGIEYAAAGVPFIASALPEYQRLHDEFGIGRTVRKFRDWQRHATALLDPETRALEAKANREALEPLTIARRVSDWANVYRSLTA